MQDTIHPPTHQKEALSKLSRQQQLRSTYTISVAENWGVTDVDADTEVFTEFYSTFIPLSDVPTLLLCMWRPLDTVTNYSF